MACLLFTVSTVWLCVCMMGPRSTSIHGLRLQISDIESRTYHFESVLKPLHVLIRNQHRKQYFGKVIFGDLWPDFIVFLLKLFRFTSSWEVCFVWLVWEYYDTTRSLNLIQVPLKGLSENLRGQLASRKKISLRALQEKFFYVVKSYLWRDPCFVLGFLLS